MVGFGETLGLDNLCSLKYCVGLGVVGVEAVEEMGVEVVEGAAVDGVILEVVVTVSGKRCLPETPGPDYNSLRSPGWQPRYVFLHNEIPLMNRTMHTRKRYK